MDDTSFWFPSAGFVTRYDEYGLVREATERTTFPLNPTRAHT